jgi:hypothetical protein
LGLVGIVVHAIRGRPDPRRATFLCSKDYEGDRAMSDNVIAAWVAVASYIALWAITIAMALP